MHIVSVYTLHHACCVCAHFVHRAMTPSRHPCSSTKWAGDLFPPLSAHLPPPPPYASGHHHPPPLTIIQPASPPLSLPPFSSPSPLLPPFPLLWPRPCTNAKWVRDLFPPTSAHFPPPSPPYAFRRHQPPPLTIIQPTSTPLSLPPFSSPSPLLPPFPLLSPCPCTNAKWVGDLFPPPSAHFPPPSPPYAFCRRHPPPLTVIQPKSLPLSLPPFSSPSPLLPPFPLLSPRYAPPPFLLSLCTVLTFACRFTSFLFYFYIKI